MQDKTVITEKIIESMKSIFSFSLARTNNATEAEDLSQEIIAELLSSADSLKDINAFYGWMWAVAKNIYGKYSRRRAKERNMRGNYEIDNFDDDNMTGGMNIFMPGRTNVDDELILKEDKNILRRELSLLTQKYREAVVKYYIEDKSCAQIADELSVTVETVKHLLFKARKILKEGMNMNREYGEKSYKPGVFRHDKWVEKFSEDIHEIDQLFQNRKMPGNILLSAYYTPLTMDEISMELGVAAPYLEDEIKILRHYNLLKQLQNGRYQTNIFIYTAACQEDIELKTKDLYKKYSLKLKSLVDGKISEVKELIFKDGGVSQNKLRWFTSHFILWQAACKNEAKIKFPRLDTGGTGFIWGNNHEYNQYSLGFWGIYGNSESDKYKGWIHASNYMLLENCQARSGNNQKNNDFMLAAANKKFDDFTPDEIAQYLQWEFIEKDGDSYKLSCPVMTKEQYDKLCGICSEAVDEICSELNETASVIVEVMKNHAPSAVQEQCKNLAIINSAFKNMAYTIENLCADGYLIIPTQHEFLTVYAVI